VPYTWIRSVHTVGSVLSGKAESINQSNGSRAGGIDQFPFQMPQVQGVRVGGIGTRQIDRTVYVVKDQVSLR